MCNEAYRNRELEKIARDWSQTGLPLRFPEGRPNFAPLPGFKITDRVEIIRPATPGADGEDAEPGAAEMVTRRWSWPTGSDGKGKPVYNFRSDGRSIPGPGRCLIPVDGFFEFTAPADPPPGQPKQKRKDKWAFTLAGADWFCIAGIWREHPAVGEAWAMLTCPPGPDIAPYHSRQVVVLGLADCARWLDPAVPSQELTRPLPAGSLTATQVR
jgi:putative SOS response-associated peptidase YedK